MTTKPAPRGVFSAAATPLNADYTPDHAAFADHCTHLLDTGCDGIAMLGSTGEANAFTTADRMAMLEKLVASGVSPSALLPGTGVCALGDTIALTRHALELGVTNVVMLPPFYYKGVPEEGVIAAYSRVFDAVADDRLRVVLYHIPPMSMVPITPGIIEALMAAYPGTIAGVKDSSGDLSNMVALAQAFPSLSILAGADPLMLPLLRAGGSGCITATSNLAAPELATVFAHFDDPSKAAEVEAAQNRIIAMRNAISIHPQLPSLKAMLAHRTGNPQWKRVHPPMLPLPEAALPEVLAAAEGVAA